MEGAKIMGHLFVKTPPTLDGSPEGYYNNPWCFTKSPTYLRQK